MLLERHVSPNGDVVFSCFHRAGTDPMSVIEPFIRIWCEKGYGPQVLVDEPGTLAVGAVVVDKWGNAVTAGYLVSPEDDQVH